MNLKNVFIEYHKSAKGRGKTVMDLWELLRHGGKCKCFQVDCCKGFVKQPTMDGSKKIYMSIIGDVPVYMTKEEMEAKVLELKGLKPGDDGPCTGDC